MFIYILNAVSCWRTMWTFWQRSYVLYIIAQQSFRHQRTFLENHLFFIFSLFFLHVKIKHVRFVFLTLRWPCPYFHRLFFYTDICLLSWKLSSQHIRPSQDVSVPTNKSSDAPVGGDTVHTTEPFEHVQLSHVEHLKYFKNFLHSLHITENVSGVLLNVANNGPKLKNKFVNQYFTIMLQADTTLKVCVKALIRNLC